MDSEYPPIIVQAQINAPRADVWNAITEPAQMRQWFFEQIPDFKPVVGFTTEFPVDAGERIFLHKWKVLSVYPQDSIAVQWTFGEYPGESVVTFILNDTEAGTLVRLEAAVLSLFPQHIPEFKRESGVAGWQYFIQERLPGYFK